MGYVDVCLKNKKVRFWRETGTGYQASGSNKVKLWRQWSRLLMDCCSWVLILGGACVQIFRE